MANEINISASSLKTLNNCTFKFYCERLLRLPQVSNPKTELGQLCHRILYFLRLKKHLHIYDLIIKNGIYYYKPLARYIKIYCIKYNISKEIESDLNDLILLALTKINFYHKGAIEIFKPELKFEITIGKYNLKGFIDSGAIYSINDKKEALLYDYKSQSVRFSKKELEDELQSTVYQYYIYTKYKIPCSVEFVMLRHEGTKRLPNKHIQRIEPKSEDELKGFEKYLEYIGNIINNFGYDDAIGSFCNNENFCKYICQFKSSFDYKILLDSAGKILKMVRMEEKLEAKAGERIEVKRYSGCPKWFGINNL